MSPRRLKRVVIKEELVELTGDFKYALILNQFIYWTERRRDFDRFIEEEKKRAKTEGKELNISKTGGWVYKSTDNLAEELMLGKSKSTLSRYVKELEEMGYLESRQNPEYKWDKTKQYRVNLIKINRDLLELGYHLEGYKFDSMYRSIAESLKKAEEAQNGEKEKEAKNPGMTDISKSEIRDGKMKHRGFDLQHRESKMKHRDDNMKHREPENETAIPEITSKTTAEITAEDDKKNNHRAQTRGEKLPKNILDQFDRIFNRRPTAFEEETLAGTEENSELIKKALEITALNCSQPRLSYTLTLLDDWQEKELSSVEDVEAMLSEHRSARKKNRCGEKADTADIEPSEERGWNTGLGGDSGDDKEDKEKDQD